MLGYRDDCRPLLEAADICALPSRREGLPNTLLEALAIETPVVASRVAGIPRLVEDGVNGLLIPPDDAEALSDALLLLAGDAELRGRLARRGRATVCADWSFDRRMRRVVAIYDRLLTDRERAA